MYSDCDDICDATFIDNSASKSYSPSSTRSDHNYVCDATFITDSTSKSHISVHSSMYCDISDATFIDNSASISLIPSLSSTCSDHDHACDATFICDSTSKSLHTALI